MGFFIDLDDEISEPPDFRTGIPPAWSNYGYMPRFGDDFSSSRFMAKMSSDGVRRPNPNLNAVSEAFGCYPVVTLIASHLDLNSLDSLSSTCRQIRTNLLQYRSQLMARTLRCVNEELTPDPEHTLRFRARAADWYFVEPGGGSGRTTGLGKVGDCARDLVGHCRRCSEVICRNCTIKPPAPILLKSRHRRLCPTCARVPITKILGKTPSHSSPCTPPATPPKSYKFTSHLLEDSEILLQDTPQCICPSSTYLCTPCGRGLRSSDKTYEDIWRWRARYGGSGIGGLGTGMGEGNRSFVCGRGGDCERAKWVEEEVDCDAEDARELLGRGDREVDVHTPTGSVNGSTADGSGSSYGSERSLTPGYLRHEIEGIGGVVKKKMVRMVKVGACVTEWEDEREKGQYLYREAQGQCRSWCGWCYRVVLGNDDRRALGLDVTK